MPKIKIDHVVSFSSEDPLYSANNLLDPNPSKKWKCLNPGEKSSSVVLQLEKACVISNIDIGNEHSAYVEVLASRSSSNDDFKIFLVMSTFMGPLDSRQSINVNKVRMFKRDDFQNPERNEKWDRIKIICTQPFNRHVQYGLSFITLYTPKEDIETTSSTMKFGNFFLRPNSPDNIHTGSLFSKRKELKEEEPLTGPAAIRQASSQALNGSPIFENKAKDITKMPKHKAPTNSLDAETHHKNRNRDEILYDKEDDNPNKKIDEIIEKKKKEDEQKKQEESINNNKRKEKTDISLTNDNTVNLNSPSPSTSSDDSKRKLDKTTAGNLNPAKRIKANIKKKPFNKLLEGVVLVISGIQNPERSELRRKAVEMGSKYKPNWDLTCTHLICAFINTPKFYQVQGRKGKIVKKTWIMDCYNERKRFPWRRYALDKKDGNESESEEEIWELKEPGKKITLSVKNDSGSDTEDEIERIQNNDINDKLDEKTTSGFDSTADVKDLSFDPYTQETDNDEDISKPTIENFDHDNILLDIFENHIFYIDDNLPKSEIELLKKYIAAYKGVLVDDPSDVVDVILTNKKKGNIEELQEICPEAKFVKYNWIWDCHNKQKFIAMDDFLIKF